MKKKVKETIMTLDTRIGYVLNDQQSLNRKFDRFAKDLFRKIDSIEHFQRVEYRRLSDKLDELIKLIKGDDYEFRKWLADNNIEVEDDSLSYKLFKKAFEEK